MFICLYLLEWSCCKSFADSSCFAEASSAEPEEHEHEDQNGIINGETEEEEDEEEEEEADGYDSPDMVIKSTALLSFSLFSPSFLHWFLLLDIYRHKRMAVSLLMVTLVSF